MQEPIIVSALIAGNGYDVLSSFLMDCMEWTSASTLIRFFSPECAMEIFTTLLNNKYVLGREGMLDTFVVSSIEVFRGVLEDRTNSGSSIKVNDGYTLVMLLSYI